jgi:tetratricopeptide (TPR) repeat protein
MNEAVRAQVQDRFAALSAKTAVESTPAAERAKAYGEVGEMLLAAQYFDTAERALLNARTLAPDDPTWPYYLAHLYRQRGALEQAAQFYRDVLTRRPDDVAAATWLASVYIDQGRHADAKPLLESALERDPQSDAAHYHAGRLALATRDFAEAARHLEAALAQDPRAAAVHYPLALAYRGLGRRADAEAQLRVRDDRNSEITPNDPLMDHLNALLEGPQVYVVRGTEALNRGEWAKADEELRKGLEVAPRDPMLRHRLATALFMMGKRDEAQRGFEEVIRVSPGYAPAHYSLGLLLEDRGRDAEALDRYTAAVKAQPTYVQARMRRAGVLRRSGRENDAVTEYQEVMRIDPRLDEAPLELAITLVRLRRYADARERLVSGMESFPEQPGFALALARLLAAAPDDGVRDGRRSVALTEKLLKESQAIEVGETMAMGLAEIGEFGEAVRIQRELIAAARSGGRSDLVAPLQENLRLYENRKASRTPWRNQDVGDAPPMWVVK